MRTRLLVALFVFLSAIAVLMPSALTLPQFPDEMMYVWKAHYYAARLARFDFSPSGPDPYLDPGFSPFVFWAMEQPFGSHIVYALTMGVTGLPAPATPYDWTNVARQGPDTQIPQQTLPFVRFAAVFCAALGLALIAYRLGWPGCLAALCFLAIPHVRQDLSRAWAEGPLLLGFGLCAVTWGTPWLAPTAGLAASFKLTALGLWAAVFVVAPFGKSLVRRILALIVASAVLSVTTPVSWLTRGPLYLKTLLQSRLGQFIGQSATYGGPLGFFFPSRYLWPLELGMLLLIFCIGLPRLLAYYHRNPRRLPDLS